MTATYDAQMTLPCLLARLRYFPPNDAAWNEFIQRYVPRISQWCRRWGLQPADIHDLTQEVLIALARQMTAFQYDAQRNFEAWLKTLTHRAWCRLLTHRRRQPRSGGAAVAALLESVPARDDLLEPLEQQSDWALLDKAMARVQRRVWGNTWEAFRLQALEGLPGAVVAQRLGMQLNAVYTARSNVQKLLREELRRFQPSDDDRFHDNAR